MINFPLILALVLVATTILGFMVIMIEAKDATPPRVRQAKQAPLSFPIGRIGEFAELCAETNTDIDALRRGRLGL